MASPMEIVAGFWPKYTPTPEQAAAMGRVFRELSPEQVSAVCECVYRTQRSGTREPNMALLDKQAACARNEGRATATVASAPTSDADRWRRGIITRMRRVGWWHDERDLRGFLVELYGQRLQASRATYTAPVFGHTRESHAAWYFGFAGPEMTRNLERASGGDTGFVTRALDEIFGDCYAIVRELRSRKRTPRKAVTP